MLSFTFLIWDLGRFINEIETGMSGNVTAKPILSQTDGFGSLFSLYSSGSLGSYPAEPYLPLVNGHRRHRATLRIKWEDT